MSAPAATSILPLSLDKVIFEARNVRLLKEIELTLEAGRRTVIMGSNGAGKSLLLRVCHGLLEPTEGAVRWAINDREMQVRKQAMVFQRPVMLRRSAGDNVLYALKMMGVPRPERQARMRAALKRVGLEKFENHPARLMSLGEQQRLAIGRAYAQRPEVLFLDEPTASVDPTVTLVVEDVVGELAEQGVKIIMTTHDMGQARRIADEVIFLDRGRLLEFGPARDFFAGPQHPTAAAFLEGRILRRPKRPLEPRNVRRGFTVQGDPR